MPDPNELIELLSPREKEVLTLWLQDFTQKQIAGNLGIGHQTVNTFCTTIRKRFGVSTNIALGRFCAENGIFSALDLDNKGTPVVT